MDYDDWHIYKRKLAAQLKAPYYKEREIWWCSLGMNVGYEIFGKSDKFTRPVLIIKKFSPFTFLGAPLTSALKEDVPALYPYCFRDREGSIRLDQLRTMDARRLDKRMGRMDEHDFEAMKKALIALIK